VSGLGCATLLMPETGLHVLEQVEEGDGSPVDRAHVRVTVAGRPAGPRMGGPALVSAARAALGVVPAAAAVVRRYRPGRAPLVRDAVRGYRTGRVDRVLGGDFDLF
jgi:ATP-dependent Clp protease ATP-binding subunit ClpC